MYYFTALINLLGAVDAVGSFVRTPYHRHVNINPDSPLYGQVMATPNESEVSAMLRLRCGVTGTMMFNCDSIFRNDANRIMIFGTKGILMVGDVDQIESRVQLICDNDAAPKVLERVNPYVDNWRGLGIGEMALAIREKREHRANPQQACHVMEILSSILESGASGKLMKIETPFEPKGLFAADLTKIVTDPVNDQR